MWLIHEYFNSAQSMIKRLLGSRPPRSWSMGDKGDIVLVHGFNGTWHSLEAIGNALNTLGFRIHVVPALGIEYKPMPKLARILADYIEQNKLTSYSLVCHSKGGLITKWALDNNLLHPHPHKVICIATPFNGTSIAIAPLQYIRELHPSSTLIAELSQDKGNNHRFVSIFPHIDNLVFHPLGSRLANAHNIKTTVYGHTRILRDSYTLSVVQKALE